MSERLVEFLYILARDELPMGALEDIMWNHVNGGEPDSYCNTYLEGWARNMAKRLTSEDVSITNWKHMYKPAPKDRKTDNENERYYVKLDGTRTLVDESK